MKSLESLGLRALADFDNEQLSTKPSTWTGQKEEFSEELAWVKGAQLAHADLRYLFGGQAFLMKAVLQFAQLQGTIMYGAQLQRANLSKAELQEANLSVNPARANVLMLMPARVQDRLEGADLPDDLHRPLLP